jgi:5,10-methylenetetrahydromethanopterin reductase
MVEIWRGGGPDTGASPEIAKAIEAEGWDGQVFMCSQSLSPDPWAQMAVWASHTERLQVAPGVTNPFTRNIAVTAGAAATVQQISNGRCVLGIGRGDSALAFLGRAPVGIKRFETALRHIQTLLSGGEIPFEEFGTSGDARSVHDLPLGHIPDGVSLEWLPEDLPKVPLDVAATGPKVIRMAATIAERVTFSVGAQPERLEWALGVARAARQAEGKGDDGISYGAHVVVICNPDEDQAMEAAHGMTAGLARFQVMEGTQAGPADAEAEKNLDIIKSGYDMTAHVELKDPEKLGGGTLSRDFIHEFSIVGGPDHVTERLLALKKLGLERFSLVGPSFYPQDWPEDTRQLFVREVMPVLQEAG